ncbi:MAG: transcriptional regulator [Betaproteobacteria bacterium]|nr:transcriptional regulator [Betaproteobacteria bacterium]
MRSGVQRQRPEGAPQWPQGQGCVPPFPFPVTLRVNKSIPYPKNPQTIAEHIRKARGLRKLTQRQAALLLGVAPFTVLNWEKGHTEPPAMAVPTIRRFLGYDPYPAPTTLPERLLALRRLHGWSIAEAARKLGVDEGTWGGWEQGHVILYRNHRALLARLLELSTGEVNQDMRVRWNQLHQTDVGTDE